jgi:large subunit ribosomal protein L35
MKTKKIITKRFRKTGTGKIMHRTQGMRHLRSNKNKSRQRRQNKSQVVTTRAFARMISQHL